MLEGRVTTGGGATSWWEVSKATPPCRPHAIDQRPHGAAWVRVVSCHRSTHTTHRNVHLRRDVTASGLQPESRRPGGPGALPWRNLVFLLITRSRQTWGQAGGLRSTGRGGGKDQRVGGEGTGNLGVEAVARAPPVAAPRQNRAAHVPLRWGTAGETSQDQAGAQGQGLPHAEGQKVHPRPRDRHRS